MTFGGTVARGRRAAAWAAAAAVVVTAAGLLLYLDVRSVRASLQAARAEVADADPEASSEVLAALTARVTGHLDDARVRSDGPLWAVADRLPWLGRATRTVGTSIELGTAAITLADQALAEVGPVLDGDRPLLDSDRTAIDLEVLADVADVVDALDLTAVERARDRLAAIDPDGLPGELVEGREELLDAADRALAVVDDARQALSLARSLLGEDGPRSYLLMMQTSGELRGTGGLLGFYAELLAVDGRLTIGSAQVFDALDDVLDTVDAAALPVVADPDVSEAEAILGPVRAIHGQLARPVPRSDEFAARYDQYDAARLEKSLNVDPDLPTTAPVVLEFYRAKTGRTLDGVIAMDPIGLAQLMRVAGRFDIVGEAPEGLPATIDPATLDRLVLFDVYQVAGADFPDVRKPYLQALGLGAFRHLFATPWDPSTMGRAIAEAVSGRHLQLYLADEDAEADVLDLGAGGAMVPRTPGSDLLAVTANNAVCGKHDTQVGHRVVADLLVEPPDTEDPTRSGPVTVELVNEVATSGLDPYLNGNCLAEGTRGGGALTGPVAQNRTWWTLWSPALATATAEPSSTDAGAQFLDGGTIHGHTAFDAFVTTPAGATSSTTWTTTSPIGWVREGDAWVYRLTWWRQAKAVPDQLDLTLRVPESRAIEVLLHGGGDGIGFGPLGANGGVTSTVGHDRVRIVGNVTADLEIELRLWD